MQLWLSKRALVRHPGAAPRMGVLILVVFALVVFVANVPTYIAELGTVCTGPGCNTDQLTAEGARALRGLGLSVGDYAAYFGGLTIASALVWFGVAALIVWRKFDDPFALFVALTLVLTGAFPVTGSVSESSWLWSLPTRVVNSLELVCFLLFLCLFPDGRFVTRWTPWVALGAATLGVLSILFPENPLGPLWFVFAGSLVGAQVYRYRHTSTPAQRQQTKWVVFAIAMVVLTVLGMFLATQIFSSSGTPGVLTSLVLAPVASVTLLLIPLSIGIAILRYRLLDIDLIINRTLVYAALTACVAGIYILVVGYLGALVQTESNLFISLIATGIVAVLFQPLRVRLQRTVDRLMYGERDDPYAVISRLGERLEATLEPRAVLPAVVETVREALRLPYSAIALEVDGSSEVAASSGEPVEEPQRMPLTYQNEPVGELLLAPRPGEEDFSDADRRLLEDLARQAGVAAHAVRLTAELQRARERLVSAREEERRRLRRDLHDGLGPQLSSQTLTIDAVRSLMRRDPDAAEELLVDLKSQAQDAIFDIRRLVYSLRPPALDDLGLLGALRESAAQYGHNGLDVRVDAPEELPALPAAVEVAAYRIFQEAVTNVARHAQAGSCTVSLTVDEAANLLRLEVRDDGRGMPEDRNPGVGLASMRERAAELGGRMSVEALPEGGTVVRAQLPLPEEASGFEQQTTGKRPES